MRELRLAREYLETFRLNLTGLTVFTEAATDAFAWTAAMAAMAGADRVIALGTDAGGGVRHDAVQAVATLGARLGMSERVEIVYDRDEVAAADIITNLGSVRPIDGAMVRRAKSDAVVPLMWETWEWREEELDLGACLEAGIMVLGTNERHESLRTFEYVGHLAAKLTYDVGVELLQSRVVVVGGGVFGEVVTDMLVRTGAHVSVVCRRDAVATDKASLWCGEYLSNDDVKSRIEDAEVMVFADHESERMLVGANGDISVEDLRACNEDLVIVHVSGLVDGAALKTAGYRMAPDRLPNAARKMSVSLGYLGPRPVIGLHAAGLKVGEVMARARRTHPTFEEAKAVALQHPLCQDFPPSVLDRLRSVSHGRRV